jgi:hypothetical protein
VKEARRSGSVSGDAIAQAMSLISPRSSCADLRRPPSSSCTNRSSAKWIVRVGSPSVRADWDAVGPVTARCEAADCVPEFSSRLSGCSLRTGPRDKLRNLRSFLFVVGPPRSSCVPILSSVLRPLRCTCWPP